MSEKYAVYASGESRLSNSRKYKISDTMMKCDLFKAYFEESKDVNQDLSLNMFETEFIFLNTGSFNVEDYTSVGEINHAYNVLGYFGLDGLIRELDEHVYYLEMTRIPDYVEEKCKDYFLRTRFTSISNNTKLSEHFFTKHETHALDWDDLLINTKISETFFERHISNSKECKINFSMLCHNTNISEEFFEKYIDRVDWVNLSVNQSISENFIERHKDLVIWYILPLNSLGVVQLY